MSTHTLIYILLFFAFIFVCQSMSLSCTIAFTNQNINCENVYAYTYTKFVLQWWYFMCFFMDLVGTPLGTKYVYHNQPFPPDLATTSGISPVRSRTIASTFFFAARNPSPSAPLRSIHWRWSMWHLIDMTPDILTYSTYCILFEYIYICIWDNIKIIIFAIILNIFP